MLATRGWFEVGDLCAAAKSAGNRRYILPKRNSEMSIDRAVMLFAGFMVLISLALGFYVSPYWYLLAAFVGELNSSLADGFCPAAMLFKRLGMKPGPRIE